MTRSSEGQHPIGDERLTTLMNNVNAVRAISSAVEGTLGPKGLDTMLVDERGHVVITNDGVTILERMEVKHPAARMLIRIATAQQEKIGDGTTTATIMASSLVQEGAAQIHRGVPPVKVIAGIRQGVATAERSLARMAAAVTDLTDPHLRQTAYIAARENQEISDLVLQACHLVGDKQLVQTELKLADLVEVHQGEESEVIKGILLQKRPVSRQMPSDLENPAVLLLEDRFGPEGIDDEALGTEIGFKQYLENKENFLRCLEYINQMGVRVIICEGSCDSFAEEYCADVGITVIHRIPQAQIHRLAEHLGAIPVKLHGLLKLKQDFKKLLGSCKRMVTLETKQQVRFLEGAGKPTATILIGASTPEIVGERGRIAKDAASSVQAAIRGGIVPGGGSVEVAMARELEQWRSTQTGLEGYGVDAVIQALQRPISQMIINAGFNPFEKLEEVRAAQSREDSFSVALDLDSGRAVDMIQLGVVDPVLVKKFALKAAGEVAESILRIHTIIRMKETSDLLE
ncbi:TCP-1/cpn60 chaperonin family protein [Ammoniphilus resinae]|uniref:Chaperonin GroEL (HSP60 family) n=1 Tax=Ammoniphilus resinae TaxID=861532 RepID=A0ABS4GJS1_9BACL|nr:TCP-1/cpn60 chaperonin family protein [Ammoniphilus resinae]MBP1930508.1 chaperonin GroEL (HSP60 family) [Ammoniphilus resinae]